MTLLVNSKYCLKQLNNCGLYTKYSLKTKSARSSLMRVFCIGVSPLDQSRESNSYTGKIDQTWSKSLQTFNRPTINNNLLAAIGMIADRTQLRAHCLSYQISHPPPGAYLNLVSWHADYRWSKNNGWPSNIVMSIVFISFISRKVLHLSIIKVRPLLVLFDLLWLVKKWIWFYSRGFFFLQNFLLSWPFKVFFTIAIFDNFGTKSCYRCDVDSLNQFV